MVGSVNKNMWLICWAKFFFSVLRSFFLEKIFQMSKLFLFNLVYFRNAGHFRSISSSARRLKFPTREQTEASLGINSKSLVRVRDFLKEEAASDPRQFIKTIEDFDSIKKIKRFGYAEFVAAVLPMLDELGLEKDLESYKALMRIFPKGAFVPYRKINMAFVPYIHQQKAAMNIISKMHENRLMPDKEMEQTIVDAFSEFSHVWQKCARLIYWQTKMKNRNPFPFPEAIPTDSMELAIIALKRMTTPIDPQTDVTVYQVWRFCSCLISSQQVWFLQTSQLESGNEDTWICFSQSDAQQKLIEELDSNKYRVSLDGPCKVWVEQHTVTYFVLRARDMSPKPQVDVLEQSLSEVHDKNGKNNRLWNNQTKSLSLSLVDVSDIPLAIFGSTEKSKALDPMRQVHIEDDGIVLSIVATGTSSQESLVTFIKMLEKDNPSLKSIPIVISSPEQQTSQHKATTS